MSRTARSIVTMAVVALALAGEADAQEVIVGPCGGTSVSPTGRAFQCARDKRPVCNKATRVCYCVTRRECQR